MPFWGGESHLNNAEQLMASPFRTSRRVEFAHTGRHGIVHIANFFRCMASAEVEVLSALGLSVSMRTAEGERFGFPRVSASCDFMRPVTFLDVIDVTVSVESVGHKSVT